MGFYDHDYCYAAAPSSGAGGKRPGTSGRGGCGHSDPRAPRGAGRAEKRRECGFLSALDGRKCLQGPWNKPRCAHAAALGPERSSRKPGKMPSSLPPESPPSPARNASGETSCQTALKSSICLSKVIRPGPKFRTDLPPAGCGSSPAQGERIAGFGLCRFRPRDPRRPGVYVSGLGPVGEVTPVSFVQPVPEFYP